MAEKLVERNSEGTFAKVLFVVGLVLIGIHGAVGALMSTELAEIWPFLATIDAVFASIVGMYHSYNKSRPAKKLAMAELTSAQATLITAKALAKNPPQPPVSPKG